MVPAADWPGFKAFVEEHVRNANITIIEGINASQYGIGMACGRVVEAMTRNERAVFPLGCHIAEYGVTLSMPVVIGRQGVERLIVPPMSPDERAALERSATTLKAAMARFSI
jgi:L-lactate dehydrogenase